MLTHIRSSVHQFVDLENSSFCAKEYSHLKFGSDEAAKRFGYRLADDTYEKHKDVFVANRAVVIPSPYNVIPNAATIMAQHFMNRLNWWMIRDGLSHLDWSIIHRKVSYTADYGFLPKEKRESLLNGDQFYLNRDFLKDKLLIFVDDVRITGTHEEKLVEILHREEVQNDCMFLYYAIYGGDSPDIESKINFAGIKTIDDYLELATKPNHHIIIRPVKYMLSRTTSDIQKIINTMSPEQLEKVYMACLAEGYYSVPDYKENFLMIENYFREI